MKDNDYLPQTLTVDPGHRRALGQRGAQQAQRDPGPGRRPAGRARRSSPAHDFEQKLDTPGALRVLLLVPRRAGQGHVRHAHREERGRHDPAEAASTAAKRAGASGKPRTIHVPKDVKRIQTAVDQAPPGSLILVSPGVYKEAVTVTTDRLVIRGLDRNKVILDGGFKLDNGIKVLGADGVAVENMTARNYTKNGFFWTGVEGLPRLVPDRDAHR